MIMIRLIQCDRLLLLLMVFMLLQTFADSITSSATALSFGSRQLQLPNNSETTTSSTKKEVSFTYQWQLFRQSNVNIDLEDGVLIVHDAVNATLAEQIVEHKIEDKIAIQSLEFRQNGETGCSESSIILTGYPICDVVLTDVVTVLDIDANVSDTSIAKEILQNVQNFAPTFNSNPLQNPSFLVQVEFVYPITVSANFMIMIEGVDQPMNQLEQVVYQLVLEDQLGARLLSNFDPPYEIEDILLVAQISSGTSRRLSDNDEDENNDKYIRIMVKTTAVCGGTTCQDDNFQSTLLEVGNDVIADVPQLTTVLVETQTVVEEVIQQECDGSDNINWCEENVLEGLGKYSKESEGLALAVLESKLDEELILLKKIEAIDKVANDESLSYFSDITGVAFADSTAEAVYVSISDLPNNSGHNRDNVVLANDDEDRLGPAVWFIICAIIITSVSFWYHVYRHRRSARQIVKPLITVTNESDGSFSKQSSTVSKIQSSTQSSEVKNYTTLRHKSPEANNSRRKAKELSMNDTTMKKLQSKNESIVINSNNTGGIHEQGLERRLRNVRIEAKSYSTKDNAESTPIKDVIKLHGTAKFTEDVSLSSYCLDGDEKIVENDFGHTSFAC